jgi:hypothetical protein
VGAVDFTIEIGTTETHAVHLHFNHWFGQVHITVDGEDAASRWRMFTIRTTQRFEFPVGKQEHHDVVIEKTRQSVLGGFRSQTCRVMVDNQIVAEFRGSVSGKTTKL